MDISNHGFEMKQFFSLFNKLDKTTIFFPEDGNTMGRGARNKKIIDIFDCLIASVHFSIVILNVNQYLKNNNLLHVPGPMTSLHYYTCIFL